mmetsp:Transcript_17050/g.2823  ORF Transcript_17050/g.2823 Transcript_17050/m.2823 type:complete len:84 (+) Transcript_17050:241-492(+)
MAFSSVNKFLLYNFVSSTSQYTLSLIVSSVINCPTPEVFTSSDEVVIMKLLHVLLECLRQPSSKNLSDDLVWGIVQKCLDVFM